MRFLHNATTNFICFLLSSTFITVDSFIPSHWGGLNSASSTITFSGIQQNDIIKNLYHHYLNKRRKNHNLFSHQKQTNDEQCKSASSEEQHQQHVAFHLKSSINEIDPISWNSCLQEDIDQSSQYKYPSASPFLQHSFLRCLEESGCTTSQTGWVPQHIEIKINGTIAAYVPLFVKGHSMGEFIFDSEFANYAQQNNLKYYPKLLVGIPFSPVAGSKILMTPELRRRFFESFTEMKTNSTSATSTGNLPYDDHEKEGDGVKSITELRQLVKNGLKNIAISNNVSSVHMNFLTDEEAFDIAGTLPQLPDRPDALVSENEESVSSTNGSKDNNRNKDFVAGENVSSSSSTSSTISENESNDTNGNGGGKIQFKKRVKNLIKKIVPSNERNEDEFIRRTSLQYHWMNSNPKNDNLPYLSFEDYLGCFKSKKRITIRRERRRVTQDEHIRIDAISGQDILKYPGLVERMFEIYKSTVEKMWYGRQYLNLDFFQLLVQSDFVDNLVFLCAREKPALGNSASKSSDNLDDFKAEDVFAGTFNIMKDGVFYGRYWGCLPGYEVKNLHFEVCYWSAIEYCITKGLKRMEPGAGGGDYKWGRGFDPVLIHSAHYFCHPALRKAVSEYVQFDSGRNVELSKHLKGRSALKTKTSGNQ